MTTTLTATCGRLARGAATAALLACAALAASAHAGSYIVAQCSPGLYSGAPDARFGATTTHYASHEDCGAEAPGLEITHRLGPGETGTLHGAYGAWVWQAPPGTYITGGTVYSRLASEDGEHGYLVVSPDSGQSLAFETVNDDRGHGPASPPVTGATWWRGWNAPSQTKAAAASEPPPAPTPMSSRCGSS